MQQVEDHFCLDLPMGPLFLDPKSTIMDLHTSLDAESETEGVRQPLRGKIDPSELTFASKENIAYGVTSPLHLIMLDSFNVTISNQTYFVHIPKDVVYEESLEFPLETAKLACYMNSVEKKFLPSLSHRLVSQFSSTEGEKLEKKFVVMAIRNGLQELSIDSKLVYRGISKKISFLESKLDELELSLGVAEAMAEKSASRRLKAVFGAIVLQVFLIQYGTYYVFSWDIMEPLTCLLGVTDVIIAYGFWLRNRQPYSFQDLWKNILSKRRAKYQAKLGVFTEDKEEIIEMIEDLKVDRFLRTEKLGGISAVLLRNEAKSNKSK